VTAAKGVSKEVKLADTQYGVPDNNRQRELVQTHCWMLGWKCGQCTGYLDDLADVLGRHVLLLRLHVTELALVAIAFRVQLLPLPRLQHTKQRLSVAKRTPCHGHLASNPSAVQVERLVKIGEQRRLTRSAPGAVARLSFGCDRAVCDRAMPILQGKNHTFSSIIASCSCADSCGGGCGACGGGRGGGIPPCGVAPGGLEPGGGGGIPGNPPGGNPGRGPPCILLV
jgi:hypothetical protein